MALSEGLKGFVNFFTKSFNDGSDDEAFMDLVDRDGDYDTDGTLALDTMYGTRVNNKPERSFERESKVISHPNSCLLYTSPSPRDVSLSRMPSSA